MTNSKLSWIDQAIIVIQTHFYTNVVLKESSVQYTFRQEKTSSLMGDIDIFAHTHTVFNHLSVGLLGSWRRMTIMVTNVHPIVDRGSMFKVFALCMDFTMALVTP
jgi:hypothetical protein